MPACSLATEVRRSEFPHLWKMSTYSLGFIGLGVMGYPMVLNLVKKVNLIDKLHVYDISNQDLAKLEAEAPEKVDVCASALEVTEKSVRFQISHNIKLIASF